MERKNKLWLLVFLLILVDQLSKVIFLQFFYQSTIYNQGIAFGLFPSNIWLIINLILVLFLAIYKKKEIGSSFIIAGGLSNLIDRIFRGAIIDFINLKIWPSFNLADIFISMGIVIYLVSSFAPKKAPI